MLKKIAHNRLALVSFLLAVSILFLSRCVQKDPGKAQVAKNEQDKNFAGSAACKNCHAKIYENHLQTFHHLTSSLASDTTIKGSFEPGENSFHFNSHLYIAAEKKDSQFYQTAYQNGTEKVSRKFDFVVGSAKRGQTFLYWKDNYIFQLPLTYFTATNEWTNSPGYSNKVQFNRPITIRCLECHSTNFVEQTSPGAKADEFSKSGIILGIECEKCHGPSAEHMAFQQQHPNDKTAHAVIRPSTFSRTQKLDMCRVCHGGRLNKTQPSFSFAAGDKLSEFFNLDSAGADISTIDVHGNQYGMLAASKCFKGSQMTCVTCHDPHKNEAKALQSFSAKCLSCHTPESGKECGIMHQVSANFLTQNCVDCHMPEQPSKTIMVLREGQDVPTSAYMRSHFISVYKDESQKRMKQVNSQ